MLLNTAVISPVLKASNINTGRNNTIPLFAIPHAIELIEENPVVSNKFTFSSVFVPKSVVELTIELAVLVTVFKLPSTFIPIILLKIAQSFCESSFIALFCFACKTRSTTAISCFLVSSILFLTASSSILVSSIFFLLELSGNCSLACRIGFLISIHIFAIFSKNSFRFDAVSCPSAKLDTNPVSYSIKTGITDWAFSNKLFKFSILIPSGISTITSPVLLTFCIPFITVS